MTKVELVRYLDDNLPVIGSVMTEDISKLADICDDYARKFAIEQLENVEKAIYGDEKYETYHYARTAIKKAIKDLAVTPPSDKEGK